MIPDCPCISCSKFGSCQSDCETYTNWLEIGEAE